jgi:hypothetical protein
MDATQRRTVSLAAYAVSLVLFVFFFGRQAWDWAAWDSSKGTVDFGFMKITSRPPFPNDVRSVMLGLVTPIVIAAFGRIAGRGAGHAPEHE